MQERYWCPFITSIPTREPEDLRLRFFCSERAGKVHSYPSLHLNYYYFFSPIIQIYLFSHLKMPYFHSCSCQVGYLLCEISQDWAAVQITCMSGVSPRQPSASSPWNSAPCTPVLSALTLYKYCMKMESFKMGLLPPVPSQTSYSAPSFKNFRKM